MLTNRISLRSCALYSMIALVDAMDVSTCPKERTTLWGFP